MKAGSVLFWVAVGAAVYALWSNGTLAAWTNGLIPPPVLSQINTGGWLPSSAATVPYVSGELPTDNLTAEAQIDTGGWNP